MKIFLQISQDLWAEKRQGRKSNESRQKNRRGDSKIESNDSPNILDRGKMSEIPRPPLGSKKKNRI